MEPCSLLLPYRFLTVRAFDTACHEYSSFLPFTTLFVHLQARLLSLTVFDMHRQRTRDVVPRGTRQPPAAYVRSTIRKVRARCAEG